MEQDPLNNTNICWKTKLPFYSTTSGGLNSNMYLNTVYILDICDSLRYMCDSNGKGATVNRALDGSMYHC
jgi:hypothetical protein